VSRSSGTSGRCTTSCDPAEIADLIASFKEQFVAANAAAAAARAADPMGTDAGEVGEAHSNKTLATE
jgi:hypothetical protein